MSFEIGFKSMLELGIFGKTALVMLVATLGRYVLVSAQTDVKLIGGDGSYGAVEVTHKPTGSKGMLCDDVFQSNWHGAAVVCRMLGFKGPARYVNGMEYNMDPGVVFVLDGVNCTGNETSLDDCTHDKWGRHDCFFKEQAGVVCEPERMNLSVSLMGGDGSYGAVQISRNGREGAICDDNFRGNLRGPDVICRMLGYQRAYNYTSGWEFNPVDNVTFLLDDVECNGDEPTLAYCKHRKWATSDCTAREQAGVICARSEDVVVG